MWVSRTRMLVLDCLWPQLEVPLQGLQAEESGSSGLDLGAWDLLSWRCHHPGRAVGCCGLRTQLPAEQKLLSGSRWTGWTESLLLSPPGGAPAPWPSSAVGVPASSSPPDICGCRTPTAPQRRWSSASSGLRASATWRTCRQVRLAGRARGACASGSGSAFRLAGAPVRGRFTQQDVERRALAYVIPADVAVTNDSFHFRLTDPAGNSAPPDLWVCRRRAGSPRVSGAALSCLVWALQPGSELVAGPVRRQLLHNLRVGSRTPDPDSAQRNKRRAGLRGHPGRSGSAHRRL